MEVTFFDQFLGNLYLFTIRPFIYFYEQLIQLADAILSGNPFFMAFVISLAETAIFVALWFLLHRLGRHNESTDPEHPVYTVSTGWSCCHIILSILLVAVHAAFHKTFWIDQFAAGGMLPRLTGNQIVALSAALAIGITAAVSVVVVTYLRDDNGSGNEEDDVCGSDDAGDDESAFERRPSTTEPTV